MGYKTEINYILKCSNEAEGKALHKNLKTGNEVKVTKSGERTFVLNSPIMIADHNWNILGMCLITEAVVSQRYTKLKAKILTVFTPQEKKIVSKVIQDGEKAKIKIKKL